MEREIGTDGSGGGRMAERAVRSYGNIVRERMCRRWRWSDIREWDLGVRHSIYCCEGMWGRDCAYICILFTVYADELEWSSHSAIKKKCVG